MNTLPDSYLDALFRSGMVDEVEALAPTAGSDWEMLERVTRALARRRSRRQLAALLLAAVLIVGMTLGALAIGGGRLTLPVIPDVPALLPIPSQTAVEPGPSIPYVVSGPVSGPGTTRVEPGIYRMRGGGNTPVGWPGSVIVTIPDDWWAASVLRGGGLKRTESGDLASLDVTGIDNLDTDPCSEASGPWLEPSLGPSVDDLVGGLQLLGELEVTDLVDVTLDGWHGKRLEFSLPTSCGAFPTVWRAPAEPSGEFWTGGTRGGWLNTMWILDVDGLRFVVIASHERSAPEEVTRDLEQMVESIDIEP